MMRAVSDLQKIRRTDVQALVDAIPVKWQVNKQARDALVNFICDRVTYLIENFVSRRWPQGELELC